MKAVYIIGILNFTFNDTDGDYFHHEVKLVDLYTHKVFYDKLTFIYLEMPKFNKKEDELESMFDNGCSFCVTCLPCSSVRVRCRTVCSTVFSRLPR